MGKNPAVIDLKNGEMFHANEPGTRRSGVFANPE
jgi:hypothetical protein